MAKYEIAGVQFRTKNEIVEYVRRIFDKYRVGAYLDAGDFSFVMELLRGHSRYALKVGCGISAVRIDLNTEWKAYKMFTLIRVDGSEADVSYRECIYPTSKRQHFAAACRRSVVPDVLAFKQRQYDEHRDSLNRVPCELTGEWVHWDEAHVDHAPPWTFQTLVEMFLESYFLPLAEIEIGGDEDGAFQSYFADEAVAESFRAFHNERAVMRVLSKTANLKLGKK